MSQNIPLVLSKLLRTKKSIACIFSDRMNNDNTEKVITSNVTCDRNDNIDNIERTIVTGTPHSNNESCSTGEPD